MIDLEHTRATCIPVKGDGTRKRPLALDLFCGGGGAGMGLFMAGFDVVGYNIKEQREYPFEFVNESALTADVSKADFIWASPPCQSFSGIIPQSFRDKYGHLWDHQNLITPIREKLARSGKSYVIENVQGACSELRNLLYPLRDNV